MKLNLVFKKKVVWLVVCYCQSFHSFLCNYLSDSPQLSNDGISQIKQMLVEINICTSGRLQSFNFFMASRWERTSE